ncbi:hypothetical protein LCGC14_0720200 [marine sediment metagenome]|uniref:ParB-like N-terminal domain-containing protein n=1 Tax=marine sediment metagenome TaxID=412755 RepID=A0A0F9SXZ5_9ZZZZ
MRLVILLFIFIGIGFVFQTKSVRRNIKIKYIKVDDINDNRWMGDDKLDVTLAKSIQKIGLLQNIIVRPISSGNPPKKKFILVHGERRLQASIIAGKTKISCIVLYNLTGRRAIIAAAAMCFYDHLGKKKYSNSQIRDKVSKLVQLLIDEQSIGKTKLEIKRIRREAIKEVANLFYNGEPSTVYKILQIKNLPNQLQALIKEEGERTETEKLFLEKFNIKSDFKSDLKSISIIEKIFQNLGARPQAEKIQKIFAIINNFGLDKKKCNVRNDILREFRDNLKKKPFEIVMRETMISDDANANIQFTITNPKYLRWHRIAIKQNQLTSAQIVQNIYCKWLNKKFSREHLREFEAELNRKNEINGG